MIFIKLFYLILDFKKINTYYNLNNYYPVRKLCQSKCYLKTKNQKTTKV